MAFHGTSWPLIIADATERVLWLVLQIDAMSPDNQQAVVLLFTLATAAGASIAAAVALIYGLRLRHQRLLRDRDMTHRERLAAIEKGLELPSLASIDVPGPQPAAAALPVGVVLLLGGIGIFVAFRLVPTMGDSGAGLHNFASLGLIPAFAGAGLVLFSWMARLSAR
jgi:uncharacterized protein DUF6249